MKKRPGLFSKIYFSIGYGWNSCWKIVSWLLSYPHSSDSIASKIGWKYQISWVFLIHIYSDYLWPIIAKLLNQHIFLYFLFYIYFQHPGAQHLRDKVFKIHSLIHSLPQDPIVISARHLYLSRETIILNPKKVFVAQKMNSIKMIL